MKEDLDKIFAEREARLSQEQATKEAGAEARRRFIARADESMTSVLLPELKDLRDDLVARGHECSTSHEPSGPRAAMSLRIVDPGQHQFGYVSASTIVFQGDEKANTWHVSMTRWSKTGRSESSTVRALDKADREWARGVLLRFVNDVVSGV